MLAALCFAIVFAICLTSFAAVTYISARLSTRNLAEARSVEVAEAGLELALYTINNENSSWSDWNPTTYNGIATSYDGQPAETATFTMSLNPLTQLPSGLVLSSTNPIAMNFGNGITAQVTVTVVSPLTNSPYFVSVATVSIPNEEPVIRKLTAVGSLAPGFVNALAATSGPVIFQGGGTIDSYTSPGPYTPYGYKAVVSSGSNLPGTTVSLLNADVYGYAVGYNSYTASGANWLSYGGSAKVVGPNSGATTIDSTRIITNPIPYQPLLPESPEPSSGVTPYSSYTAITGTVTLGSFDGLTPAYYDVAGDVTIGGTATVEVSSPVILYVHGNFSINPGSGDLAQIIFDNTSGLTRHSLEVHMLGLASNVVINGGSGSINIPTYILPSPPALPLTPGTPLPQWFTVAGTNVRAGSVTLGTASPVYGTFYFPYAPVSIGGNLTIYGSIVGSSITFTTASPNPSIFYDSSLRLPTSNVYDAAFHGFQRTIVLGNIIQSAGP